MAKQRQPQPMLDTRNSQLCRKDGTKNLSWKSFKAPSNGLSMAFIPSFVVVQDKRNDFESESAESQLRLSAFLHFVAVSSVRIRTLPYLQREVGTHHLGSVLLPSAIRKLSSYQGRNDFSTRAGMSGKPDSEPRLYFCVNHRSADRSPNAVYASPRTRTMVQY
jgi:hypothetical protein